MQPQPGEEFVVKILVAYQVRETIDARPQQALGVLQIKDMSDGAQVVLVRLINRRAIQFRRQLLLGMVSKVDPDLDEVGVMGRPIIGRPPLTYSMVVTTYGRRCGRGRMARNPARRARDPPCETPPRPG